MIKKHYILLLVIVVWAFSMQTYAQANRWRDHEVKKKETIFGIARQYGLTINELIQANPEMNTPGYELKRGDHIRIPYKESEAVSPSSQKTTSSTTQKTSSSSASTASRQSSNPVRVGVMLPLHDVDGDGRRMIEYYRGILLACDSLKRLGVNIDLHAWNVAKDADIRQTLFDKAAQKCDVIFGPLYTKQMKALSDFVRTYGIRLVVPFSISGNDVQSNPNITQIYQSPSQIDETIISHFLVRFSGYHTVFIDCNDSTSRKGTFTSALRQRLEYKGYNITNLKSDDDVFAKAFSTSSPNVVVLNTGRSPELNATFAKLNKLVASHPGIGITLFGYNEWLMYTKPYQALYHQYDTYIPSWYYRDPQSASTLRLESRYRTFFGQDMMYALPRFALTGFDHAMFFLKGIHEKGRAFCDNPNQSKYVPVQTPLHFQKAGVGGGMQNRELMFIHYTPNKSVVKVVLN